MNFVTKMGLGLCVLASLAQAENPVMGGPMKHIGVMLNASNNLEAHLDTSGTMPELKNYGETYSGSASVLDGLYYNAQYGWMVEGFWSPPSGSFLWIEQIDATPGLMAFSGGTMMNQGSFDPIFGTDGSSDMISWNGSMLHNWYAVESAGEYEATYRVFLGDAAGEATPGFGEATVTLNWFANGPDCVADLASPFGVLDFFDVQAFLNAFSQQQAQADLAEPFGVFDFFDVQTFLSVFSQGCP